MEGRQKTGEARQAAGTVAEGRGVFTCGGVTEATHGWVMLSRGLTWRSDAHVLLAVHHETSHWLPIGVIGCSLTYWKGTEHSFSATASMVTSSHSIKTQSPHPQAIGVGPKKRGKHLLCKFSGRSNKCTSF